MKVAILGTRGIPNGYGGFEQFAEFFSEGLVKKNINVTVYNPHYHFADNNNFKNVNIIHKWCPEDKFGAFAHYIYDYLCLKDAIRKNFDIIIELGYATVAPSFVVTDFKKSKIITNLDGLEHKRSKWNFITKKIIKISEKIAVEKSHYLISDNSGIRDYFLNEYGKESTAIPYGSDIFDTKNLNENHLENYSLNQKGYFMSLGRIEPENNLDMILSGFKDSNSSLKFIVVGNHNNKFGNYLKNKYKNTNIHFLGAIYDIDIVNNLRFFSKIYFHGHSVGGTNPSLVEAMGSSALIASHDNIFNKAVLKNDALYFENSNDVKEIINNCEINDKRLTDFITNNLKKVESDYNWKKIINDYWKVIEKVHNESI